MTDVTTEPTFHVVHGTALRCMERLTKRSPGVRTPGLAHVVSLSRTATVSGGLAMTACFITLFHRTRRNFIRP